MTDVSAVAPARSLHRSPLLRRGSSRIGSAGRPVTHGAAAGGSTARPVNPRPGERRADRVARGSRRRRRAARGGLAFVAVIAALAAVAVLTGRLTPVVTRGTSMHPTYHSGDLVVVADTGAYGVGDIVAYRADEGDPLVLHRIIARTAGATDGEAAVRFVMRGDRNVSTDPFEPAPADIVGRAVLHVPGMGILAGSRAPLVVLLGTTAALGLLLAGRAGPAAPRRRVDRRLRRFERRHRPAGPHARNAAALDHPLAATEPVGALDTGLASPGPVTAPDATQVLPLVTEPPAAVTAEPVPPHPDLRQPDLRQPELRQPRRRTARTAALAALVVADVAVAAALVAAFAMPPGSGAPTASPQQTATLRYGASVAPGVAYPDGRIETGQPVFRQLSEQVDVSVDYAVDGPTDGVVRADASLWLELLSSAGWSQTTVLAAQELTSQPGRLEATVGLDDTAELVGALAAETGVASGASTVRLGATFTPTVDGIAGDPLTLVIDFDLSDKALVMRTADQVTTDAVGGPALVSTAALAQDAPAGEGTGIPRPWRRWILVTLVVLVTLTALLWPSRPSANVVPVRGLELSPHLTRIRVDDPAALDEIAGHEHAPVLAGDGWRAVIVEQRVYWDGEAAPGSRPAPLAST
jgi:signal peptidase I